MGASSEEGGMVKVTPIDYEEGVQSKTTDQTRNMAENSLLTFDMKVDDEM